MIWLQEFSKAGKGFSEQGSLAALCSMSDQSSIAGRVLSIAGKVALAGKGSMAGKIL